MSPLLGCMDSYNVRDLTFISNSDSTSEEKQKLRKKNTTIVKWFVPAGIARFCAKF